ncbi:MAG: hypothetical protein AAGC55_16360, partial [Myxococcota bacterium]
TDEYAMTRNAEDRDLQLIVLLGTPGLEREFTDQLSGGGPLAGAQLAALGTALDLCKQMDGQVTALAFGDQVRSQRALRTALAAGCTRAVYIDEPQRDEEQPIELDYLAQAMVFTAAVGRFGCDILLCPDGRRGPLDAALGPAVAELCSMAHLTGVIAAAVDRPQNETASTGPAASTANGRDPASAGSPDALLVVHRGGGQLHRFRCPLPIALSVMARDPAALKRARGDGDSAPQIELAPQPTVRQSVDPDFAADSSLSSVADEREAEQTEKHIGEASIERIAVSDLGVDLAALSRPTSGTVRPVRTDRKLAVITDAAELVARLAADRLLP